MAEIEIWLEGNGTFVKELPLVGFASRRHEVLPASPGHMPWHQFTVVTNDPLLSKVNGSCVTDTNFG